MWLLRPGPRGRARVGKVLLRVQECGDLPCASWPNLVVHLCHPAPQVNKEVAKDSKEAQKAAAEAEAAAAAKKQAGLDAVLASLQQAKKVGGQAQGARARSAAVCLCEAPVRSACWIAFFAG